MKAFPHREAAQQGPQSWPLQRADDQQVQLQPLGWWILGLGLVALVAAEGRAEPLALLGGAAWCSVGLGWLWVRQHQTRLRLRLSQSQTLRAGARSELLLQLHQDTGLGPARDLLITCHAEGSSPSGKPSRSSTRPIGAHLVYLPAGTTAETSVASRFPERGHLHRIRVEVRSSDPLGLFITLRSYLVEADIKVLPKVGRSRLLQDFMSRYLGQQIQASLRGDEEFFALREHRLGESYSKVHWKHSLRRGRRLVRELTRDTTPRLRIALCCQVVRAPGAPFEEAVSMAATLVEEAARMGITVGLTLLGERPQEFPAGTGRQHGRTLSGALCTVRSSSGSPYEQAAAFADQSTLDELWIVLAGEGQPAPLQRPGVRVFDVLDPSIGGLFRAFPVYVEGASQAVGAR